MARKPKGRSVDGVFLLNKASGASSNKVLQQIKRLYQAEKAGHTGALDPLATGMLPICFGEATKFSQYLLDADKVYETTAKLGVRTTTSDAEGEVVEMRPLPENLSSERVTELLEQHFHGEVEQVPSIYSALKHQGQPLYKLARKGIEVEVKPRKVMLYSVELLALRTDELDLRVHCSKGTYIRSLVEDLGQLLGCGAHVQRLHRISAGRYSAEQMMTLEQLETQLEALSGRSPECIQNFMDGLLLPAWSAIEALPSQVLDAEQAGDIRQGKRVSVAGIAPEREWRLFDAKGQFLGLGESDDQGTLKGKRLIRSHDIT